MSGFQNLRQIYLTICNFSEDGILKIVYRRFWKAAKITKNVNICQKNMKVAPHFGVDNVSYKLFSSLIYIHNNCIPPRLPMGKSLYSVHLYFTASGAGSRGFYTPLYSTHFTLDTFHCTLYTLHYVLYSLHYTLLTIHYSK